MLLSGTTLYRKILNKRVPDGEVVGNVQRIALCNKGLNPCSFAGRFFMNDPKMRNLFSETVAGHNDSSHACTISTVNSDQNY